MPTALPRPRRANPKVTFARTILTYAFNTFMVVSALALGFVVLVREENYALGQGAIAPYTLEIPPAPDATPDHTLLPPSF